MKREPFEYVERYGRRQGHTYVLADREGERFRSPKEMETLKKLFDEHLAKSLHPVEKGAAAPRDIFGIQEWPAAEDEVLFPKQPIIVPYPDPDVLSSTKAKEAACVEVKTKSTCVQRKVIKVDDDVLLDEKISCAIRNFIKEFLNAEGEVKIQEANAKLVGHLAVAFFPIRLAMSLSHQGNQPYAADEANCSKNR